jgi:glycosyltransferase involved in cell wall biosynthesis
VKILVLTNLYPPDFLGGYELGCQQVVDALIARGHNVRVLTSSPRRPVHDPVHVERRFRLADRSDPYLMGRLARGADAMLEAEANFLSLHNVHALLASLDSFAPDVCYVWNLIGLGGLGVMAALVQLRVPWVWHLMDAVPIVLCSRRSSVVPRLAREFEERVSGRFIACSERLLREIEAGGIRLRGPVEVIPNWVTSASKPRLHYYAVGDHLRLVSAGQIGRHKGTDIIIQMAHRLREQGHDNFSIDIFGRVTDPYFNHLIRKLDLGDHVRFGGMLEPQELTRRYADRSYDMFLFPTWEREPFAFAPLEAAAAGCVPVLSAHCGNADLFIHGLDCLKAERTPEAFADVVESVLRGRTLLPALAKRAARLVSKYFHLDRLMPSIESVLMEAAADRAGTPAASDEVYRLAALADKLTQTLVQEAASA